MEEQKEFLKQEYFTNRELSWISFNERVLGEARDKTLPLLERVKFLGITASNLDEFFMVRVASLKDQVHAGYTKTDFSGMKPMKQLEAISEKLHEFCDVQYSTYNRSLVPGLEKEGIRIIKNHEDMTETEGAIADHYFMESVYPVLTPMAVDPSRPFPLIRNKSLNIGALLRKREGMPESKLSGKQKDRDIEFATVQVPAVLPRLFTMNRSDGVAVILLEEIIERNIQKLFLNYDVVCAAPYRIMRNADLTIDEDEAEDLLKEIEKRLKMRQWGEVIKLEAEDGMDKKDVEISEKRI